jgi:methyl-accepting chemotaxis protein
MLDVAHSRAFARTIAEMQGGNLDRPRLLQRLALAFGLCTLLIGLVLIVMILWGSIASQVLPPLLVQIALSGLVAVGTFWLVRKGNYKPATQIFFYGSVFSISVAIYTFGGVAGPIFGAYLIPIIAAGLLGKAGDGARLFVVSLACYTLLALIQILAQVEPALRLTDPTGQMIFYVIVFGVVGALLAYMAMLWSSTTAKLIKQAHEQSEALLGSNEKLLEKNIQQVELGSELSAAASELLAASHQQASGATEQASAVSQVSTTIEELGSTARQIAIAAEQVAEAAQQTLENLSEGQDAVDRSIQAMERIRNRMQDVSTRVLSLGERSQQIGEIIDLINDLSDETHLLALNAAIEAAGAGEHGRRFAVVAAEVKSLANRALAAAKEVKGVIAEIQQATNAAVLAAEEGGKEVERGVELAHSAGQVMDAIVMVAERTAQSGAEISLATAQQQSASEQVVETMREVADVARQTAAGSRQMSESAQMLTAIAERLHGIVYEAPQTSLSKSYFHEVDERMHAMNNHKE